MFLHSLTIILTCFNLLSGLRIATLEHPELLVLSALLPQGELHSLHIYAGLSLVATAILFIVYSLADKRLSKPRKRSKKSNKALYHRFVQYFGLSSLLLMVITGLFMYTFEDLESLQLAAILKPLHYLGAWLVLLYICLHVLVYIAQYGMNIIPATFAIQPFTFQRLPRFKNLALASVFMGLGVLLFFLIKGASYHSLNIQTIAIEEFISIDGEADEEAWKKAVPLRVNAFGAANFDNGNTEFEVKALQNGSEMFFHIRWRDASKSLKHLPLIKTQSGWKIQEDGFYNFNETRHYEDKLAVILSKGCEFGAAGTAHLGPKPLKDKPANWHGKGYHYTQDNNIVDLWHWKAVRTNDMYLADDNFIGQADIVRPAQRRYTAGYMQDGKEAGAYVMNWKWYKPSGITPKRLPKDPELLSRLQNDDKNSEWVIPWFSYEPYTKEKDTYAIGTVMPSVMYRSNRFEGDRADVRARGVWKEGYWSLELVRNIETSSLKDVTLSTGVCMWLAAFDHSQIAHSRHLKPIKIHY